MNRRIAACILLLGSLSLSPTLRAEIVDKIVAVVGSEVITLSDLREFEKMTGKSQKELLQDAIQHILLKQEIERLGITASNDELSNALRGILRQNQISLEALRQELAKKGIAFDQYRESLREEIKKGKFIGQFISPKVTLTDTDLEEAQEDKKGKKLSTLSVEEREKLKEEVFEAKLKEELNHYLRSVRERTYIETFD